MKSLGFSTKPVELNMKPQKVSYFLAEPIFCYPKLLKRFVAVGLDNVSKIRSFKGFVDLNNRYLDILNHLDAFSNLLNHFFLVLGEIVIFFECIPDLKIGFVPAQALPMSSGGNPRCARILKRNQFIQATEKNGVHETLTEFLL